MSDICRFGWFIVILALAACAGVTPAPERPAIEAPSHSEDPRIAELLEGAQSAFDQEHLTTPVNDNAYLRYLQVLAIDPHHEAANTGIADIVERYLAWAVQNARSGNMRRAADYLAKARSVDESHPNIEPVVSLIRELKNGRKTRYTIDLKDESHVLAGRLQDIGRDVDRLTATVIIRAPTDKTGRWLYQLLNEQTTGRLRATFETAAKGEIILLH